MGVRRLFFIAGLCCWALQGSAQATRLPDVYLVTIDTLRADHVGCYGDGHVETPALDRLCGDGLRFAQAFTPSPITNSSHASILTGLLPSHHGVTDFAIPLRADHPTLAETLHQAGYLTGAFIGAVILDSKTLAPGFDRGFDFYFNFPATPPATEAPNAATPGSRYGRVERRGKAVVQRAERWLAQSGRGPRFAWVHLYDPHDPYDPPAPFAARYHDRPYDGEIAYADSALAGFLRFLDRRGLYRDSIIIVVGDHGEGLGEHGEETHGIFLYDSTLHVPLIIKLPRAQHAGTVVVAQVRTIDIVPTILDLLRLPTPTSDGATLQPLWSKGEAAGRVAFGETDYPFRFGWAPLRSVRTEDFKYIDAPRPELYDLKTDCGENSNIYEPWAPPVERLRQILADARLQPAMPQSAAAPQSTVDELKALGYLGNVWGATTASAPSLLPDPKDKVAEQNFLHRAMLADESGDVSAARAALQKVLELDPLSPAALLQAGELESRTGNYRAAAELLARARAARPQDPTATWYLGRALFESGEYPKAREALEASLRLLPGQLVARLLLAETLVHLEALPAAQDQLEAALLLAPSNLSVIKRLATVQSLAHDYDAALGTWRAAARLAPRDAEIQDEMAKIYRAQGKTELAERAEGQARALRKKTTAPSRSR